MNQYQSRLHFVFPILLWCCMVFSPDVLLAMTWKIEKLMEVEDNKPVDIAVDTVGRPVIVYSGDQLMYLDKEQWHFYKSGYLQNPDIGGVLAIGPDDHLHLAFKYVNGIYGYYDSNTWYLQDRNKWSFQEPFGNCTPKDIELDAGGNPHLLCEDSSYGYLYSQNYHYFKENSWNTVDIHTCSTNENWYVKDLAIDNNNEAHVVLITYDSNNKRVSYGRYDGTQWHTYCHEFAGAVRHASIATDENDQPHIAVGVDGTGIVHTHYDGVNWNTETIQSSTLSNLGSPSVAYDSKNTLHVIYHGEFLTVKHAWLKDTWQIETVELVAPSVGPYAMDIDNDDRIHIAYVGSEDHYHVRYAVGLPDTYVFPDFTLSNTQGNVPHTVLFNDTSLGENTTWLWNFGDNTTSNEQHPQHIYTKPGVYTVSLEVSGPNGTNRKEKAHAVFTYDITNISPYRVYVGEIDQMRAPPYNRVSVIDPNINEIIGHIPLPSRPFDVTPSHDGTNLLVSLFYVDQVHHYFDLFRIPYTYPEAFYLYPGIQAAYGAAVSPDNAIALVTSDTASPVIKRINLSDHSIKAFPLEAPAGGWRFSAPQNVVFSPDGYSAFLGSTAYAAGTSTLECSFIIHVMEANSDAPLIEPIKISGCSSFLGPMFTSPDNRHVYVGTDTFGEYTVDKILLEDVYKYKFSSRAYLGEIAFEGDALNMRRKRLVSIPIAAKPLGMDISPDNKYIIVSMDNNNVSIIDVATEKVVKSVAAGSSLRQVSISPDARYAYVGAWGKITVIDLVTLRVSEYIPTSMEDSWAFSVAIAPLPPTMAGDVDNTGRIDLKDVILSLKAASGDTDLLIDLKADANEDEKIGIFETIFNLKHLVGAPVEH